MAYDVVTTLTAKAALYNAIGYALDFLESPQVAQDLLEAYEGIVLALREMPETFPRHKIASEAAGLPVHRAPVKQYGVFYTIDNNEHLVVILAFLHERQDIPKHLEHVG